MDELKEVLNVVQYDVDILTSLCSEKKGPNCDQDASSNVPVVNSTLVSFSQQSVNIPTTITTSNVNSQQKGVNLPKHPENRNFTLHIGVYNGTLGDSLSFAENMQFSTYDRDNDIYTGNCAKELKGAFWYTDCHRSNLNGAYLKGKHESYADGIEWHSHSGYTYSSEKSSMGMIEP